jgi:hypothetical protein
MGRPPIGDRAMSDAERQRRRRERLSKAAGPKPAKAAKRARAAADDRELTEARAEIERLRAELAAKALPEIKKKSEVPPTALAAYIASIRDRDLTIPAKVAELFKIMDATGVKLSRDFGITQMNFGPIGKPKARTAKRGQRNIGKGNAA